MKNYLIFIGVLSLSTSCNNKSNSDEETHDLKELPINSNSEANFKSDYYTAPDGITVYGNLYEAAEPKGVILLCHQAQFNKFEYAGIGERLVNLGYTCLAIDQRSGGPIGDKQNETNIEASEYGRGTDYLDAIQDIAAGVDYLKMKYSKPIILWGSSYSSTLVLYEAAKNENVSAVVSFSPGNYFADTLGSLVPLYAEFSKPMFLTSGNWEVEQVSEIIAGKELIDKQVQFIPKGEGHHGSRALWVNQNGGEEYWEAIEAWLDKL